MQEEKYINFLKHILDDGEIRPDRTGVGTVSLFGEQIKFDISKKCPILTTKKVPWKYCIEELLWFLKGSTNSKELENKGVNIWRGNSSRQFLDNRGLIHYPEGDIGPGYGFQWRHYNGNYIDCNKGYNENEGYDQIKQIINDLNVNPYSRRIILSAWNPGQLDKMALPPCHCFAQFYASSDGKELSCHMYQRSVDAFLGFPWNIMSYTVLTYIIAKKCGMKPKNLIISTGDTHIYTNHIAQVKEQIGRDIVSDFPILNISDNIIDKDFSEITIDDFEILEYNPQAPIKASMAI